VIIALAAFAAGLWLAVFCCRPRPPIGTDPDFYLIYRRLMGGPERLLVAAVMATLAAALALTISLPSLVSTAPDIADRCAVRNVGGC
jgi:hypothetical protein